MKLCSTIYAIHSTTCTLGGIGGNREINFVIENIACKMYINLAVFVQTNPPNFDQF